MTTRSTAASAESETVVTRRRALTLLSAAGLVACGHSASPAAHGAHDAGAAAESDDTDPGADATDADAGAQADAATGSSDGVACSPAGTNVGPATNFAEGRRSLISAKKLIVGRDAGGLFAYSAVCTQ